jgi:hypothetical protein
MKKGEYLEIDAPFILDQMRSRANKRGVVVYNNFATAKELGYYHVAAHLLIHEMLDAGKIRDLGRAGRGVRMYQIL